jgi:hypothetical protein
MVVSLGKYSSDIELVSAAISGSARNWNGGMSFRNATTVPVTIELDEKLDAGTTEFRPRQF